MNNDRASSFLCLFQTFQTFMSSSVLAACATRDTEHLPGGVQPDLQFVLQHCAWVGRYLGTCVDGGMDHPFVL